LICKNSVFLLSLLMAMNSASAMARIAILGATGYTALELFRILSRHPTARVVAATTRQTDRPVISSIHPSLTGLFDLPCENLTPEEVGSSCDIAFCCLPHTASMEAVPKLLSDCRRRSMVCRRSLAR
jgi:N-acetyl-gamma-glutamyl-phosphate reductase